MFAKGADIIGEYEQHTDFKSIGEINLSDHGNLPFYIIEHRRQKIPLEKWDELMSHAVFEFDDTIEVKSVRSTDSKKTKAK